MEKLQGGDICKLSLSIKRAFNPSLIEAIEGHFVDGQLVMVTADDFSDKCHSQSFVLVTGQYVSDGGSGRFSSGRCRTSTILVPADCLIKIHSGNDTRVVSMVRNTSGEEVQHDN